MDCSLFIDTTDLHCSCAPPIHYLMHEDFFPSFTTFTCEVHLTPPNSEFYPYQYNQSEGFLTLPPPDDIGCPCFDLIPPEGVRPFTDFVDWSVRRTNPQFNLYAATFYARVEDERTKYACGFSPGLEFKSRSIENRLVISEKKGRLNTEMWITIDGREGKQLLLVSLLGNWINAVRVAGSKEQTKAIVAEIMGVKEENVMEGVDEGDDEREEESEGIYLIFGYSTVNLTTDCKDLSKPTASQHKFDIIPSASARFMSPPTPDSPTPPLIPLPSSECNASYTHIHQLIAPICESIPKLEGFSPSHLLGGCMVLHFWRTYMTFPDLVRRKLQTVAGLWERVGERVEIDMRQLKVSMREKRKRRR